MDRQYGSTTAAVLTRLPELVLPLTGWYVHDVEQKIAAIGTVTLDSEEAIQAARAAYDALSDQRKAQVSNYDVLLAAEKQLAQLQDEAVAHVEELIDAIGQPVIPGIPVPPWRLPGPPTTPWARSSRSAWATTMCCWPPRPAWRS